MIHSERQSVLLSTKGGPVTCRVDRCAMILGCTVAAMVALVIAGWHLDRSYWNDEAWGVDFAMQPSLFKVWQAAKDLQLPGAPGYLALLHGADQVRGMGSWVYRIPSIAAGLAMVLVAVAIARQWCQSWALACTAGLLLLASPFVQRYFTEAKQYIGDAAFTLSIILATRWWIVSSQKQAAVMWAILAAVGVTMSFAFWYAVAGTGLLLLIVWLRRRDRQQLIRVMAAGAVAAVSGAVVYFGYARAATSGQSGMDFWQVYFLSKDLRMFSQLWNHCSYFLTGSWWPYDVPGGAMLVVSLLGLGIWCWRDPITGAAAILTLLATFVASLVGLWPMVIRVNLAVIVILNLAWMAVPLGLAGWLLGVLRKKLATRQEQGRRFDSAVQIVALTAAFVLAGVVLYMSRSLEHEMSNVRSLLQEVARRTGPQDQVILDWAARVNFTLEPTAITGTITSRDWPDKETVGQDLGSLIRSYPGRSFLVTSIDNHERVTVWEILARSLADVGTLEKVWTDQSRRLAVSIYEFRRH